MGGPPAAGPPAAAPRPPAVGGPPCSGSCVQLAPGGGLLGLVRASPPRPDPRKPFHEHLPALATPEPPGAHPQVDPKPPTPRVQHPPPPPSSPPNPAGPGPTGRTAGLLSLLPPLYPVDNPRLQPQQRSDTLVHGRRRASFPRCCLLAIPWLVCRLFLHRTTLFSVEATCGERAARRTRGDSQKRGPGCCSGGLRREPGRRCRVMWTVACPSRSATTFGCSPASSSRVAAVCRRSYTLMSRGRPARSKILLTRRFLEAAREDRAWPLWWLLLETGLRPSEALALRWEDVDFERRVIRIQRSLVRVGRRVLFGEPNTRQASCDKG